MKQTVSLLGCTQVHGYLRLLVIGQPDSTGSSEMADFLLHRGVGVFEERTQMTSFCVGKVVALS